jgi:hypothetical protein
LVNVAVTDLAASIVTVQAPVPLQAPVQPVKVEAASGVAVRITSVAPSKVAVQVKPQAIPTGVDVTSPSPVPARKTVSVWVRRVKVAVTDLALSIVTVQVKLVPVHAPVQPSKVEVASGVTVRETVVSVGTDAEQVEPQSIAAGVDTTVPDPEPAFPIASG